MPHEYTCIYDDGKLQHLLSLVRSQGPVRVTIEYSWVRVIARLRSYTTGAAGHGDYYRCLRLGWPAALPTCIWSSNCDS